MPSELPNWAMLCFLTKAGNTAGNQSDCKNSEPSANGGDIKDSRCRQSDPRFDPKKLCDSTQPSGRVFCHSGSFALPQSPWKHRPQKSCGVVATHRPPRPYIFRLKPLNPVSQISLGTVAFTCFLHKHTLRLIVNLGVCLALQPRSPQRGQTTTGPDQRKSLFSFI